MKKSSRRGLAIVLATLAVAALVAGCSAEEKPAATTPTDPAAEAPATQTPAAQPGTVEVVEITDSGFEPVELKVSPGSTVTWKNTGAVAHSVVFLIDSRTLGSIEPGDTSASVLFNTPGVYGYKDAYHQELIGAVIVE